MYVCVIGGVIRSASDDTMTVEEIAEFARHLCGRAGGTSGASLDSPLGAKRVDKCALGAIIVEICTEDGARALVSIMEACLTRKPRGRDSVGARHWRLRKRDAEEDALVHLLASAVAEKAGRCENAGWPFPCTKAVDERLGLSNKFASAATAVEAMGVEHGLCDLGRSVLRRLRTKGSRVRPQAWPSASGITRPDNGANTRPRSP